MQKFVRVNGKKVKLTPGFLLRIAETRARAQGANAGLLKQNTKACPYPPYEFESLWKNWIYGHSIGTEILKQRGSISEA